MPKADKKIFSLAGQLFTLVKGKRWYLEYYTADRGIPERRRAYGGANRIKDLVQREAAFMALAAELAAPVGAGCVLLDALEARRPAQRLKTWQSQKTRLRIFLAWLGTRSPCSIDKSGAAAFVQHLVAMGRQSATIDSYKNTLSAIYQAADLENPWRGVVAPKVVSRSLMYFRKEETAALMAWLQLNMPMVAMAVKMLYYCFIRPGEMRLLTADCVNFENATITIPAAISKNGKTGTVVIPAAFLPEMKSYLNGVVGAPFIFSKAGGPGWEPVHKNYLNGQHRLALAACKIKGRYAFYSWKHTGAVNVVRAGINLKDLQLQLRHHSLDMVNEYLKDLGVLDSEDLRNKFPAL